MSTDASGETDPTAAGTGPLVSVVIPTYNRARLIGRAIRSVLDQTCADLELIVVDDGSTDDTGAVLGGFRDPRVRVLSLPENRGVSAARNAGIAAARGAWIAFLDSDDEWRPSKLERQLARARVDPDAVLVYCQYERHDDGSGRRVALTGSRHEGHVLDRLLEGWAFPPSLAIVRRQPLLAVGGFAEDLRTQEDHDLWLRLAAASHEFALVPEPLVVQHQHAEGHLSGNPSTRPRDVARLDARWGALVTQRLGPRGYRRWRKVLERRIHFARFLEIKRSVAQGDRRAAWRGCLVLARSPSAAGRFLVQALLLLSLGGGPYRLLAGAWNAARGAAGRR